MTSYTISSDVIEHYTDAYEQFEHLLGKLMDGETQKMTHREVETLIQLEGGELLRRMIQGHFDCRRKIIMSYLCKLEMSGSALCRATISVASKSLRRTSNGANYHHELPRAESCCYSRTNP